jgi:hypothetical protein
MRITCCNLGCCPCKKWNFRNQKNFNTFIIIQNDKIKQYEGCVGFIRLWGGFVWIDAIGSKPTAAGPGGKRTEGPLTRRQSRFSLFPVLCVAWGLNLRRLSSDLAPDSECIRWVEGVWTRWFGKNNL